MKILRSFKFKVVALFVVLAAVTSAPVWSVDYFVNQDGSAHLYNAYLMTELLRGNQSISEFAVFNHYPVPNQTVHWLLAVLVLFLKPAFITKLIVTLLSAGFAASVAWLRYQVAGREGTLLALVIGAALSMNWMWAMGFYNFVFGSALFAFTLGLWWRWRERTSLARAVVLSILLILLFLSHLVCFAGLIFVIAVLAFGYRRSVERRSLIWTAASVLCSVPLLLTFILLREPGNGFSPSWPGLDVTPSAYLAYLATADPMAFLSHQTLPYATLESPVLALLGPLPWVVAGLGILTAVSVKARERSDRWWLFAAGVLLAAWAFGPDNFGSEHGAFLRERFALLGFVCLVPFYRGDIARPVRWLATSAFIFVIAFQTLALSEYAGRPSRVGSDFVAAGPYVGEHDKIASVLFIRGLGRFKVIPEGNLTPFIMIGKSGAVWDNYELGTDIFPLVSVTREQRNFIIDLKANAGLDLRFPDEYRLRLAALHDILVRNNARIDILFVLNEQPEFGGVASEWFETEPFFTSGDLRLYRHR